MIYAIDLLISKKISINSVEFGGAETTSSEHVVTSEYPQDFVDPCGRNQPLVVNASSDGFILSPNYPNLYPNNAECTWLIVNDDQASIELTIMELALEEE